MSSKVDGLGGRDLRILLCPCHYLFDEVTEGSEFTWAYNIGNGIASRYPGSVVVTGAANLASAKPYRIVELQATRKVRDLSLRNAARFNWRYSQAALRITKTERFDILHHVLPFAIDTTFNIAWQLGSTRSAKLVIGPVQPPLDVRDAAATPSDPFVAKLLSPALRRLSRRTIHRADKVVVVNERAKQLVLQTSVPEDRIEVIPPGIDVSRFTFTPFTRKASQLIELLVVGHLSERKAVHKVVQAVGEVVRAGRNVHLNVVGDGPERSKLERLVNDNGLGPFVTFVGLVPHAEIHGFYRNAHILVSMSQAEGFATVCLEAMASGLTVVATRVGGFEEAIVDRTSGCLISQQNVVQLARTIVDLIDTPGLLRAYGYEARARAQLNYDWKGSIIPKYLNIYAALLASEPAASINTTSK